jgi:hypothetical protein
MKYRKFDYLQLGICLFWTQSSQLADRVSICLPIKLGDIGTLALELT